MQNLKSHICGHQVQITHLEEAVDRKRLPHAMLFTGPESIGKKIVAYAIAQKLLCEVKDTPDTPCGVCPSCIRVAKHQSENVLYIEPSGQNIKVDQARHIIEFLNLSNFGRSRVVIIDQAHLFNPQAANSILKILEEPSDNVFFILIAPEAESMMRTIRSRSQVIRFNPLSEIEIKSIKPGLPEWVYKCSRGQLNAVASLSSPEGMNKRIQSFDLLELFWNEKDFLNLATWRSSFKDREEAQDIIKNWLNVMRDVLVVKLDELGSVLNIDQMERLNKFSFLDNTKINLFISQLLRMQKDIQGYADSTLLVESLWVTHARK
ncbi:MAG: DNA polymerase III subunit delta' [Bdellovibrionaceae bacterium]|nr:DNA polymerase III subunit delta' [Pseudobdellovibrionaceae bacterium]